MEPHSDSDLVELHPDHPGFNDEGYRARRNAIAKIAYEYRGGPVPDAHAFDVRDGVERPRGQDPRLDAEIAEAGAGLGRGRRDRLGKDDKDNRDDKDEHAQAARPECFQGVLRENQWSPAGRTARSRSASRPSTSRASSGSTGMRMRSWSPALKTEYCVGDS